MGGLNSEEGIESILPQVPFEVCPIQSSLGVLGRKWALMVLRDVAFFRYVNFSQIMKNNPRLTPRVLSMRLRELQKDGLIQRLEYAADERVIKYKLTRKGQDTIPILTAFIQYGVRHHAGKVFEDRRPRTLSELFPEKQKTMLGELIPYAENAKPTPSRYSSSRAASLK